MLNNVSDWIHNRRAAQAAEWASLRVNLVRIPLRSSYNAPILKRLQAVTDALAGAGIYSLLCPFDVPKVPSTASGQLAVSTWQKLGRGSHLLLEAVNEPAPIAYPDTDAAWQQGTLDAITAIRAGGYRGPVFCDGRNWGWTFPVAAARAIAARDSQVVFVSHRYATADGVERRPASDADLWAAEWSQAPDLAVALGEFGWNNGGGDPSSIPTWCQAMVNAVVTGVGQGWCSGGMPWMWLWEPNSLVSGVNGGNWFQITRGEGHQLNAWGQVAAGMWTAL
jgi:hypothetical protein